MLTGIVLSLLTGAGVNLAVTALASSVGIPAATTTAGLRAFKWGRFLMGAKQVTKPKPTKEVQWLTVKTEAANWLKTK